jgi:hypothetical protein
MNDFTSSGNNLELGKTIWRLARLQFVNRALDWLIGLFRLTVSEQKDAGIYLDPYSHPEYMVRLADQYFDRDN